MSLQRPRSGAAKGTPMRAQRQEAHRLGGKYLFYREQDQPGEWQLRPQHRQTCDGSLPRRKISQTRTHTGWGGLTRFRIHNDPVGYFPSNLVMLGRSHGGMKVGVGVLVNKNFVLFEDILL